MDLLPLLQAIRLKGRVRIADLAAILESDEAATEAATTGLTDAGLLTGGNAVRLTSEGQARLAELLFDERRELNADAFAHIYDEFRSVNQDFKSLVSRWQLKEGAPNDHRDTDYDNAVLGCLDAIHQAVLPILADVSAQLPRLSTYAVRLSTALDKLRAGDISWFTMPTVASCHTLWFELHEELIGAAGLTRLDEARAGHAE